MDKIIIEDLKIETTIGAYDWEQQIKQTISLHIELSVDTAAAAQSDELTDAVDYSKICDRLTDLVSNNQFKLLEPLAYKIIEVLQQEFYISHIKLRLSKPNAIAKAKNVSLVLER